MKCTARSGQAAGIVLFGSRKWPCSYDCDWDIYIRSSDDIRTILLFFFFSSRRRHTRSDRDWSSDVCSSDLDAHVRDEVGVVGGVHAQVPSELLAVHHPSGHERL